MRKSKKIILIILVVLTITLISFGFYFVLKALNITSINTLRDFISKFGVFSWLVFLLLQVLISTPIFVIPLEDEMWVALSIVLFGVNYGFILSVAGMVLTSSSLYFCGRVFGSKLAIKFVGKENLENVRKKFDVKNKLSLPFLYLIPMFPHDVLCLCAGISKMNYLYFIIVSLFVRSIEIVSVCFLGNGLIDWKNLSVFEWLITINFVIVDWYLLHKLQVFMESKIKKSK